MPFVRPGVARRAAGRAAAIVLAALAFLSLPAIPALAQAARDTPQFEDFGVFLVDPDRPDAIILNGPILSTTLLDFRRAARAYPEARTLVLNSPGGLLAAALTIADEANEDGFATVIPSWAGCYSACAFIYLAGVERAAVGELGVHQFNADEPNLDAAQRLMADVLDILGRFDTSPELISIMLRTPPEEMHVFNANEIERFGLNTGFADGVDAFEFAAVGALAPSRGDPVQAAATLYIDPDAGWRQIDGEVDWWVEEEDGHVVVAADIRIDDDELRVGLVLGEVFDRDSIAALALAVQVEGAGYQLQDGEATPAVTTRPRGSENTRSTSFGLGPAPDVDEASVLVSHRRWALSDLDALMEADLIELWFTDRNGDNVVLQLQTTSVLASVLADWSEAAAELPLGDLAEEEIQQPVQVFVGDATEAEEGTGVWYVSSYLLAARLFSADGDVWVDIGFSNGRVFAAVNPPAAFEEEALVGISLFADLEWVPTEPGFFTAQLSPQIASRMTILLARADELEVELLRADGVTMRMVIGTGDQFDRMLDAAIEAAANAPADERPAAGAPAATAAPATARRPDFSLEPNYGEVSLASGFRPDPHVVRVQAGGSIDAAAALGGDCAGFISDAPDFRVFLTAGAAAIFISVVSDGDTTLVVNDPAGDWLCADDTGTSFNPQVRLDQAAAGQYDIWVGNYDSQGLVDATLQIGTRPIVAAGTSGKPTQPATVAQDDGGPFVELGTYRDWAVTRNNLSCFAYTVPTSVTPRNAGNDESFFTIIVGQGERFGYPSFVFSFDPNPDYFVTVRIDGGATFDFDPDDNFAYLSNPRRDEALIIAALQNGVAMEVVSVTPSGQTRTERYSLLGVTAALARATEACR